MNWDMYDTGIPKYQSCDDIYEGLCSMASGEEINILSQMVEDVSYENQDYYYAEKGGRLQERWEEMFPYDEQWKFELAAFQLNEDAEIHDIVYLCLTNDDAAKRLDFKKIFVDELLGGYGKDKYKSCCEYFLDEVMELNRFDYQSMCCAWASAYVNVIGGYLGINPYGNFCSKLYNKAKGLRLDEEKQLIVEARSMLNTYDDFIYGLKTNQSLYEYQEKAYQQKVQMLQAKYEQMVQGLLQAAQEQGVILILPEEAKLITNGQKKED